MKLYENIVIGGFLFDLGVRMGQIDSELPITSVNLLQQTPLDRPLGDVLLANESFCRLIEFKRAGHLTRKEKKKLHVLRDAINRNAHSNKAAEISREIHWFIEIEAPLTLGQPLVSRGCPYIDLAESADFVSLSEFARSVADQAATREVDSQARGNYRRYLEWVSIQFAAIDEQETDNAAASTKASSSGAFVISANKKGQVCWPAVPSLRYLFMNKYELAQALGREIEPDTPKQGMQMERDTPKQEIKIDQGQDMSM